MSMVDSLLGLAVGALASILMTGAVAKLVDVDSFFAALNDNPLTRTSAALLARSVPLVEVGVGLLLLFARDIRWPASVAGALFLGFLAVTMTSPSADCMCGPFVPKRSLLRITVNAAAVVTLSGVALRGPNVYISSRFLGFGLLAVVGLGAMAIAANADLRRQTAT